MELKQIIFLILITINVKLSYSQLIFEQDIIKGGVTAAGFSTGMGSGSGSFDIYIESGSTIKKAYLFSYSQRCLACESSRLFQLNGKNYQFNNNEIISHFEHLSEFVTPVRVYYKDVTNDIDSSTTNYNVTIPSNQGLQINEGFWSLFLFVVYENQSLSNVAYDILINEKDLIGYETYIVNNLNSIMPSTPFGFSLYTDRSRVGDREIFVNSNPIGINGGADNVNYQHTVGGVKGHFYYQNNQLFGLDDDIPNTTMNASDGLADISSFIQPGLDSLTFSLKHINYPNLQPHRANSNLAYFLIYSTPCDTFSAELLTKDTTVCLGESVQMAATGGQKYEWQPSTGLNCDTCANPVASPNESTTYTVRIFNNDSCSKVYPVRLNISQPKPDTITTKRSICGDDNGEINIGDIPPWRLSEAPLVYTVNGDTVQGPEIRNISPGNKELIITDANGCQFSDSLFIDEENITQSRIVYLDPDKGNAPLEITARPLLVNYIQNHQFVWIVNGDTIHTGNSNIFNYTFEEPGEYELIHITYNQYPHCSDTTSTTILVYPSFFANIPNVFSPNNDGINDVFEIKVSNTQSVAWQLKNRWGQIVSEGSQEVEGSHTQKIPLWDGSNAADGVYFYVITATDFNGKVYEKQGKVSVFK